MKIDKKEVSYIAKLAKLTFSEKEIEKLSNEFNQIFTHFENIDKEQLDDIDVNEFESKISVLRKDEMKKFTAKEELYLNAKKKRDGYLEIPKIID